MPGIAGIISRVPEKGLFQAFLRKLNHLDYKTDSFSKEGVHLGRVHLDYVNRIPQPVFSENKRYALIMLGEIFSFRNKEPEDIGNDADFLLNVLAEEGISVLSEINGQFVAVFHDFTRNRTILISDRYGTRPLYYSVQNKRLLFSSEVKSFLAADLQLTVNMDAISDLFHLRHLFGDKTMFREIQQLPDASILIFEKDKISIEKYYEFNFGEDIYTKSHLSKKQTDEQCEEFSAVIEKAMKRMYARNKKDILFSLSGGLDSRFVISSAKKYNIDPLDAFTVGPPESGDQKYAAMVAAKLGARHKPFLVSPEHFWENARKFSFYSDAMSQIYGPVAVMPALNDFFGKKKVTVSAQVIDAIVGGTLSRKRVRRIINAQSFNEEIKNSFVNFYSRISEETLKSVFNDKTYHDIKDGYKIVPEEYTKRYILPPHSYYMFLLNEYGRRGTLGGNVLTNLFFETRMPSYDNDFMEFALRIPLELREHQYLYRKVFTSLFPDLAKIEREGTNLPISVSNTRLKIKDIEKKLMIYAQQTPLKGLMNSLGFRPQPGYVNLAGWFRNELREKMVDLVLSKKVMSRGLYNEAGLRKIVDQHVSGTRDHAELLWQIINLEYFYENFMD